MDTIYVILIIVSVICIIGIILSCILRRILRRDSRRVPGRTSSIDLLIARLSHLCNHVDVASPITAPTDFVGSKEVHNITTAAKENKQMHVKEEVCAESVDTATPGTPGTPKTPQFYGYDSLNQNMDSLIMSPLNLDSVVTSMNSEMIDADTITIICPNCNEKLIVHDEESRWDTLKLHIKTFHFYY